MHVRIFSIKRPGVYFKLSLEDRFLFEFAVYSGLLLLKTIFLCLFLDSRVSCLIPLVFYNKNKRLGMYLQLPLQDPAFIRGPALNRENTVYIEAKATLDYILRKNRNK